MQVSAPAIRSAQKGRFVLVARYPSIEPLGINHLVEVPGQVGWECKVVLVKENDFAPLKELVRQWRPDVVGIHIWAGYHLPMLELSDWVRERGIPVVMGGPFATYSHERCLPHADWVVRGSGFQLLREILQGTLKPGAHFNHKARYETFPIPGRNILYSAYPEFGRSPIKSIFASVGCPYKCTYCHAPEFNKMHGGFDLILRSIDDVIDEAHIALRSWPETKLFYFQDDVFGFDEKGWLPEFARRWKAEVGVPFHCQMRLEMTRHAAGDRRLDLFAEAGCSGITLAIESDSEFLRDQVLFRSMPDALIIEGCRKITDRGMTLRTEQILAVPFSDITTDLGTLGLNVRINPTMAWSSVFSPYPGVNLGAIAKNFNMWVGDNDDIKESFLDRSVLRHVAGGPRQIEKMVQSLPPDQKSEALLRMKVRERDDTADVLYQHVKRERVGGVARVVNVGEPEQVGTLRYLSSAENDEYCDGTVRLQRLFNWLGKVPEGEKLGRTLVELNDNEWDWERIGEETTAHLRLQISESKLEGRRHALAREMHISSPDELPEPIKHNPHYFTFFPAGGVLAKKIVDEGVFDPSRSTAVSLDELGKFTRHHLFDRGLYKIEKSEDPIAS